MNLSLSEAISSNYCLPHTTPKPLSTSCTSFVAWFKSYLLQEKLSEISSVRINHFPSHSMLFITAPKAFISTVNYSNLSSHSLLNYELQKATGLIFLQLCSTVLFILHILHKCLMNDRLHCQKKQNLRRGNGRVVSLVLTYM